jgi:hypothetical protein
MSIDVHLCDEFCSRVSIYTKFVHFIPISLKLSVSVRLGVGAEYFRWLHRSQGLPERRGLFAGQRRGLGAGEVSQMVQDHYAKLNAVAMCFLKRNFKHVRSELG